MSRTVRLTLAGCLLTGCLSLSCAPYTPMRPQVTPAPQTSRTCPAPLVLTDGPLTIDQQAQLQAKAACYEGKRAALAATRATPSTPPTPPAGLTWRDWVLAALDGFERGINAPVTTCTTIRNARNGRVGYYTTCNTY